MKEVIVTLSAPCSWLDVERMQSWLEDMALEGYLLKGKTFLTDNYSFYKISPLKVRYRLTPVANSMEYWNERPDTEHTTLADAFGWEYVCSIMYFHIYRCYDEEAVEFHTDPCVHAEAIRQSAKRAIRSGLAFLFLPNVYIALLWAGGIDHFWRTILDRGVFPYAVFTVGTLIVLLRSLYVTVKLLQLRNRLKAGDNLTARKSWRERALPRKMYRAVVLVLILTLMVFYYGSRTQWAMEREHKDLPQAGDMPFVTGLELASECDSVAHAEQMDVGWMRSWSVGISSSNIEWMEFLDITLEDGTAGRLSLMLYWHDLSHPWLAEQVAKEYLGEGEAVTAGADGIWYYEDPSGYPAAVILRDTQVVQVSYLARNLNDPCLQLPQWLATLEK